ncbi:aminotransferase class V-fold PLP-dependent enzyme [Thermogymnomonas acidicola]|uniref:aminotransferase class V-fold PLP-dependent enzyme n=1 Tax=Thermogymnomonas acidicola TaxID=399579 RepID=UPI0009466E14|nr:aminotransferase class V-fold PLP-dependent enzyme [Thermogymnomonas acidicola]
MQRQDTDFPVAEVRSRFPYAERDFTGRKRAFLDNGAGSLVLDTAARAEMEARLRFSANTDGGYDESVANENTIAEGREHIAMLFNAPPSGRHVFSGESASSMIFRFAYALRNHKGGRDANIVTTMSEHLANYAPYIQLKRDGFVSEVRAVPPLHREDGTIDMDSLASMADHRTRIVAVTAESNLLGNKSDLQAASRIAHENDAILLVDGGVHYMPQALCDVQAIGCDFFVFSSYKMFGPRGGAFAYMSEDAVSLIDPFHVDREASRGGPLVFRDWHQGPGLLRGHVGGRQVHSRALRQEQCGQERCKGRDGQDRGVPGYHDKVVARWPGGPGRPGVHKGCRTLRDS